MPRKAKEITPFEAINYWNIRYAPFQKVFETVLKTPNTRIVHILTTTQVGKSFFAYKYLLNLITRDYDKKPSEGDRMKDKLFFIVIPKDNELQRFLSEQLLKPFGSDKEGNKPTGIETIKIPVMQEDGKWKMTQLVKRFNKNTGIPTIEFFNNCKIFLFSADANPESHISGNTFYGGLYDEYAKFKKDITNIVWDRLIVENGVLLTVTSLNEDDYNNWYTNNILHEYRKNATQVLPEKEADFCGLEIYKKEVGKIEVITRLDGTEATIDNRAKSFLIVGDLEKIYPYVFNGENIRASINNSVELGIKTKAYYQAIHRCNPNVTDGLRILSNYNAENNQLDITGKYDEINELFPYQAIGFDPGKADGNKYSSKVGWARVGMRLDPNIPKHEQFCILESGEFDKSDAYLDNLIPFLLNFKLPVLTDNSIWKVTNNTSKGPVSPIHDYFRIAESLGRLKEIEQLFKPAGGDNLRNDSTQRAAFWQIALSVFNTPQEAEIYFKSRGLPFELKDYVQYYRPFTTDHGSQIIIATDKYDLSLNAKLISNIENWKKSYDREGNLKEMGGVRSKVDCWDAASLAVSGIKVYRGFLEGKVQTKKPVQATISDMPYKRMGMTLNDIARYHGYN